MKPEDIQSKAFKEVAKNGVFALLFVGLLLYVIYDSRQREGKYQDTINTLTKVVTTDIADIKKGVDEIKFVLRK